jgi:hypothetical protein
MADAYCPFMGKKGKPWNEFDLVSIAGRVAGVPPEVDAAARSLVSACKAAGVDLERVQELIGHLFEEPVSAASSRRARR